MDATCAGGRCGVGCSAGRADCDGVSGCEVDTRRDDAHCGACGRRCASDERCRAGTCVPRLPRPQRPMSGAEVLTRRPRFTWALGGEYDGARVEVCTTRACDVVLRSADVTGGGHTFGDPFVPGVYFWRVRGRRGSTLDARPAVVWPFAVSTTEGPLTPQRVLADYDGDGLADGPTTVAPRSHIEERCFDPALGSRGLSTESAVVASIGDVDGDGFGDAVIQETGRYNDCVTTLRVGIARTIAYGGLPVLQRSMQVAVLNDSVRNAPMWSDYGIEDYDADGLADHFSCDGYGNTRGCVVVRGGVPTMSVSTGWLFTVYDFTPFAAGDLDGDLASEIAWSTANGFGGRRLEVRRLTNGAIVDVSPPRCEVLAADPIASDPDARDLSIAPDTDRDGVVDLVANATRAGVTVRVRWFGGPGAPRADRCALEAP